MDEEEEESGELAQRIQVDERLCPKGRSLQSTGLGGKVSDPRKENASGGCDARALHQLGVFTSVTAAKQALDSQIPAIHHRPNFSSKKVLVEEVGVAGEQWCNEVLKAAIVEAGWHCFKVQNIYGGKELRDLDLEITLKSKQGHFFVDGYLNKRGYMRGRRRISINVTGADEMNAYRHSTAVLAGKICDHPGFIERGTMPSSMFHLRKGIIDEKKGYFSRFSRIFELFKCSEPGHCTGACVKTEARKN